MRSMCAFRVIARSVQRSVSTSAVSPSAFLGLRRIGTSNFARSIATSNRCFSAVSADLSEALKQEIHAEKELEAENLGGAKSPAVPGFTITTNDAEVRLTKTHNNEKILVVLNVNHSVDVDEGEFEDEGQQQTQEVPLPVALPPFSIEITKGDERLCFHMELVRSPDDEGQYDFRVEEFYVAPAAKGEDEDVEASVYASSGKYIDPNLHELLFVRYLEERGFNAKFCQDLVAYATHYEHTRYVSLLTRIQNFISK